MKFKGFLLISTLAFLWNHPATSGTMSLLADALIDTVKMTGLQAAPGYALSLLESLGAIVAEIICAASELFI